MKTTTDPANWRFYFTVTDLARFLGKSPVTIRGWERKGLVTIPRDSGGDRKMTIDDIYEVAKIALGARRIDESRFKMIAATVGTITIIEMSNVRGRK